MHMRPKHFNLISGVINKVATKSRHHSPTLEKVALGMADELSKTNPKFDVDRFLTDCGMEYLKDELGAVVLKSMITARS